MLRTSSKNSEREQWSSNIKTMMSSGGYRGSLIFPATQEAEIRSMMV
jgi:hypothetical protein